MLDQDTVRRQSKDTDETPDILCTWASALARRPTSPQQAASSQLKRGAHNVRKRKVYCVCVCLFIQSSPPPQPTPPRTPNNPNAAPTRLARARRGRRGCPSRLAIQNEEEDRTRDGPSLFPLPAPRCAPQPSMDCSLERPVGVQCSRTPTGSTGVLRPHAPH